MHSVCLKIYYPEFASIFGDLIQIIDSLSLIYSFEPKLKIFFKESFETSFCLLFFVDIA
jgi:hypothetical protein